MTNKFYLRKNKFYYSDHKFHQGKATQLIGIYDNYSEMKNVYLKHTREAINYLCGDGAEMYNSNLQQMHRYLMFRNVLKANIRIDTIINKNESLSQIFDYNNLYMGVDSLEEVELFDNLYPTNSVEILFTNNDYLLIPKWNPKFFELSNQKIPIGQLTYNETSISDYHLTKGFYIDEIDFWANLEQDINAFSFVRSLLQIDISNVALLGTDNSWLKEFRFKTNDNRLQTWDIETAMAMYLNNKLLEPIFIFERISPDKVRNYEKSIYKDFVIDSYLETRFVPAHYYSHEEVMGLSSSKNKYNFWSHIFITEDLAKEIINENINLVEVKANEFKEKY